MNNEQLYLPSDDSFETMKYIICIIIIIALTFLNS